VVAGDSVRSRWFFVFGLVGIGSSRRDGNSISHGDAEGVDKDGPGCLMATGGRGKGAEDG
jgi:hypothetical protein